MKAVLFVSVAVSGLSSVLSTYVVPAAPALLNTGVSQQFKNDDGVGNYNFGYDEAHASGSSFRRESGNALGVKTGSYGLREADGRVRIVNYVADGAGFRASVATNEPGTAPSLPAAALIAKPAAVAAVPVAAPAPVVAKVAAPAYQVPVVAPAAYQPAVVAPATTYQHAVVAHSPYALPAAVAPAYNYVNSFPGYYY